MYYNKKIHDKKISDSIDKFMLSSRGMFNTRAIRDGKYELSPSDDITFNEWLRYYVDLDIRSKDIILLLINDRNLN